jgi:hypothetical protein
LLPYISTHEPAATTLLPPKFPAVITDAIDGMPGDCPEANLDEPLKITSQR